MHCLHSYCTRGWAEDPVCVYGAGHVTRFQPMMLQHFWWWDNKTFCDNDQLVVTVLRPATVLPRWWANISMSWMESQWLFWATKYSFKLRLHWYRLYVIIYLLTAKTSHFIQCANFIPAGGMVLCGGPGSLVDDSCGVCSRGGTSVWLPEWMNVCVCVCVWQWHALDRSEQAKYYEMARKEKELHMQMYPGWSARDNYATHTKKKKLKLSPQQQQQAPSPAHDPNHHHQHPQLTAPSSSSSSLPLHRLHPHSADDVTSNGDCGTSVICYWR